MRHKPARGCKGGYLAAAIPPILAHAADFHSSIAQTVGLILPFLNFPESLYPESRPPMLYFVVKPQFYNANRSKSSFAPGKLSLS